uniref:Uncharacterized protein n=1 Tax=Parascaris univalens TaxID=6257 RepID=A0A915ADK6_PARUN
FVHIRQSADICFFAGKECHLLEAREEIREVALPRAGALNLEARRRRRVAVAVHAQRIAPLTNSADFIYATSMRVSRRVTLRMRSRNSAAFTTYGWHHILRSSRSSHSKTRMKQTKRSEKWTMRILAATKSELQLLILLVSPEIVLRDAMVVEDMEAVMAVVALDMAADVMAVAAVVTVEADMVVEVAAIAFMVEAEVIVAVAAAAAALAAMAVVDAETVAAATVIDIEATIRRLTIKQYVCERWDGQNIVQQPSPLGRIFTGFLFSAITF